MRGISPRLIGRYPSTGIIPAGAGHLTGHHGSELDNGDHPRRCGAFSARPIHGARRLGSSPQVRGISPQRNYNGSLGRIIPAGAGHFRIKWALTQTEGDHPRRCGAFGLRDSKLRMAPGSSPQVRGISGRTPVNRDRLRIIPAGAGHFGQFTHWLRRKWDHPRRCGAFYVAGFPEHITGGSSPQVRGIFQACARELGAARIIPAGAGHFA